MDFVRLFLSDYARLLQGLGSTGSSAVDLSHDCVVADEPLECKLQTTPLHNAIVQVENQLVKPPLAPPPALDRQGTLTPLSEVVHEQLASSFKPEGSLQFDHDVKELLCVSHN